jgi:hypothetical protein
MASISALLSLSACDVPIPSSCLERRAVVVASRHVPSPTLLATGSFVPLAWRNLLANKPRLLRSSGGIGFAVLLMLMARLRTGLLQRLARDHSPARRLYFSAEREQIPLRDTRSVSPQ